MNYPMYRPLVSVAAWVPPCCSQQASSPASSYGMWTECTVATEKTVDGKAETLKRGENTCTWVQLPPLTSLVTSDGPLNSLGSSFFLFVRDEVLN